MMIPKILGTKDVVLEINTETKEIEQKFKVQGMKVGMIVDINSKVLKPDDIVGFIPSKKDITFEINNKVYIKIPQKNISSRFNPNAI